MSHSIDDFLTQLREDLSVSAETRESIEAEVRAHLEEAAAGAEASGLARADAETQAIAAFGTPQTVAANLNHVHPIEWDRQRLVKGIAWGALASWLIWTLVTYPLLVWLTFQQGHIPGHPPLVSPLPAVDMLFYAAPFAYGAFWVIATNPILWFAPFLLLFGALPFIWGWQARQGWKPGLAYGLGVVVGFPWLLPGVIMRVSSRGASGVALGLLVVLAIWMLVPFAMFASWLGSRARSWLRRIPLPRLVSSSLHRRINVHSRIAPARMILVATAVALVAASLRSGIQATAWANRPQPSIAQQLAAAERIAGFQARLPATLPPGMQLVHVTHDRPGCSPCWIDFTYHDSHGREIILIERNQLDPLLANSTPPNYQTSEGNAVEVHPVSWLYDDTRTYHESMVEWTEGGMSYMLSTTDDFSIDQLEQIAASFPTS